MDIKNLSPEYKKFRVKIVLLKMLLWFLGIFVVFALCPAWVLSKTFEDFVWILVLFTISVSIILYLPILIGVMMYLLWLRAYLKTYEWVINTDEIIVREGVFTRVESRVPFSRIQNVGLLQHFWERIFGWYNVHIQTAGNAIYASSAEGIIKGQREGKRVQNEILLRANKYLISQKGGLGGLESVDTHVDISEINEKLAEIIILLKKIYRTA